jgi:aminodeoxyfutalosine synthase
MSASSLSGLARKAAAGLPISEDEARDLMATTDLVTVGMIASEARRVRVGDRVTYIRVAELAANLAAAAPAAIAGTAALASSAETPTAWPPASAREVRIIGTPASAAEVIAAARAAALAMGTRPDVSLTAFSLADLWTLAGSDASRLRELAASLREAGVSAVAEVPLDEFSSADALAAAIAAVTSAGLLAPVASWHAAPEDAVASLMALHALQEQTHAFRAFAPLPRQQSISAPSTGYEDVKIVAVARAVLNNVDHIQVDWAAHGPKLAQVALLFGASDLDRVSPADDAPLGHRRAPIEEVQRNVKSAFLDPVERDGRFAQVVR